MTEQEKMQVIRNAVDLLEEGVNSFVERLGRPQFVGEEGKERFRYQNPTSLHFQVLKAVLTVSSLNALIYLLEKGYVQEMGILLRTVDDFRADIDFIQEAHQSDSLTADQKKMVDTFFAEDLESGEELVKNPKKRHWVPRKSVFASLSRFWGGSGDIDRVRRLQQVLHDTFSGYVHGAYPHTMDLYEGGTWRFRMKGMIDTPRIRQFRWQIASCTHRALNTFSLIAHNMDLENFKGSLLQKRRELEASEAYTT